MNLPTALRANAVFTLICSLICLFAGGMLLRNTGAPAQIWITGLGLMLLSTVPLLLFAASHPHAWLVRLIIWLDWGYVLTAAIWLALSWPRAAGLGIALEAGSAGFVALFALVQQRGLARLIAERKA